MSDFSESTFIPNQTQHDLEENLMILLSIMEI